MGITLADFQILEFDARGNYYFLKLYFRCHPYLESFLRVNVREHPLNLTFHEFPSIKIDIIENIGLGNRNANGRPIRFDVVSALGGCCSDELEAIFKSDLQ